MKPCTLQIAVLMLASLIGSGLGTAIVLHLWKNYKIDLDPEPEPDDK